MIARTWHGAVVPSNSVEYLGLLITVGLGDYAKTPGNRAGYVFRRTQDGVIHFLMLSFWDSIESIKTYAGGADISVPQYTAFDPDYLIELEPTIQHHSVIEAAGNPRPPKGAGLIARTWSGAVPVGKSEVYLKLMETVALKDYRSVAGNQGAFVLHRIADDMAHVVMLTFWESLETIKGFAGEHIEIAKYYDFDCDFLIKMEPTVLHHDVFEL